jgi:hypothetical protein
LPQEELWLSLLLAEAQLPLPQEVAWWPLAPYQPQELAPY